MAAAVVVAASVAAGTGSAGAVAGFGDVAEGRYFTEAVQWMVDEEITTGVSASCFATSRDTSRGEAAAFIWRSQGEPAPGSSPGFVDVVKPWQQDPVAWMADRGITTGTSPTTFSPERPVTRGEFAAFLYRVEGEPPPGSSLRFVDVVKPWQQDPVAWMADRGITTGTSATTFSPERPVTRAEAATFLYRYAGAPVVTVDPTSPTCVPWDLPDGTPIVAVLGDSTATRVVAGLRAVADAGDPLVVVDGSSSGCSALIDRLAPWRVYRVSSGYLGEFSFDEPCRPGVDELDVVPDIVVIVDHGSVMADHLRADDTWASVLDADLRADLRRIYRARMAEAAEVGATLVFTTAPRLIDLYGLLGDMDDPERLEVYNALLDDLAGSAPGVELLDLGAVLDESGTDGPYARPDGLHLDVASATRLAADVLVPALADLAPPDPAR